MSSVCSHPSTARSRSQEEVHEAGLGVSELRAHRGRGRGGHFRDEQEVAHARRQQWRVVGSSAAGIDSALRPFLLAAASYGLKRCAVAVSTSGNAPSDAANYLLTRCAHVNESSANPVNGCHGPGHALPRSAARNWLSWARRRAALLYWPSSLVVAAVASPRADEADAVPRGPPGRGVEAPSSKDSSRAPSRGEWQPSCL